MSIEARVVESDYMTVLVRPYGAGAKQLNVEVVFGNTTKDAQGVPTSFQRTHNTNISLTDADIATWGTDDTALLSIVATKVGTVGSDFVTIAGDQHF